jgi:YbgC/YbaW family acyl-CoA thioester hydrolase
MKFGETHLFAGRVEFDDLDMGGVVHHPNYLKFYERARSAAMAATPYSYARMWEEGLALAVAEAYLAYRKPLRLYQNIWVCTRLVGALKGNFKTAQAICGSAPSSEALRQAGDQLEKLPDVYHHGLLRLVCIDMKAMRGIPSPQALLDAFQIPPESSLSEEARQVRVRS